MGWGSGARDGGCVGAGVIDLDLHGQIQLKSKNWSHFSLSIRWLTTYSNEDFEICTKMYLSTVKIPINFGINWPGRSITFLISKPILLLNWSLFHLHWFCVYLVNPSLAFKSLPILVLYVLSWKRRKASVVACACGISNRGTLRLTVRILRTNWQFSLEHATEPWLCVQMHMENEPYHQTGDNGVDWQLTPEKWLAS